MLIKLKPFTMKVIFCDDDPFMLKLYDNLFKKFDIEKFDAFDNAEDVLERLSEDQYDILVTDLEIGKMSGIQLIENIIDCDIKIHVYLVSSEVGRGVYYIKDIPIQLYNKPNDLLRLTYSIRQKST